MTPETVYILIEQQFLSVNGKDRKRPTWYRQEAVLKRETRLVVDLLCASISDMDLCKEQGPCAEKHKLRTMTLWHAYVLSGSVHKGNRCLHNSTERYRWIRLFPEEAVKICEDKYVIDALFRARCMELEDDLVLTVGSFVNLKLSVKWVLQQHTR